MEQRPPYLSNRSGSPRRKWWLVVVGVIVAIAAIGWGTVAILAHFNAKKAADTPGAPAVAIQVSINPATPTEASISWSGLSAGSYELQCATTDNFTDAKDDTTTQPTGTCSNLQPLQTYHVRVRVAGGVWSKSQTFATSGETYFVVGVQAKRLSSTTASVSWQPTAGVQTYQLEYSTDKQFAQQMQTQSSATNSTTLQGLKGDTPYYVRVKAVVTGVADNLSPYSVPAEVK